MYSYESSIEEGLLINKSVHTRESLGRFLIMMWSLSSYALIKALEVPCSVSTVSIQILSSFKSAVGFSFE